MHGVVTRFQANSLVASQIELEYADRLGRRGRPHRGRREWALAPDGRAVDDIERNPGLYIIGLGLEAHDGDAAAVERDRREVDTIAQIASDSVTDDGLLTHRTAPDGR